MNPEHATLATIETHFPRFPGSPSNSQNDFHSDHAAAQDPGLPRITGLGVFDSFFCRERTTSRVSARSPVSPATHPTTPPNVAASPAAMFLSVFTPPAASAPILAPDAEGQKVGGFTLGEIIGYGAFSTIRRASSSSGGTVAVKIVRKEDVEKQDKSEKARKRLAHEATVWSSLSHEHILPLFSAVHTSYADYFFTLCCPAGSLFDILKRDGQPALPQDDVGMMFRQVVRGLRYLHEDVQLVHRDIKLENVLVDESGVCRITDFGLSRSIGEIDEEDDFAVEAEDLEPGQGVAAVHRTMSLSIAAPIRRQTKASLSSHHPSLIRRQEARHRNSTSAAHADVSYPCQPGSLPYAAPELFTPSTHANPHLPHPSQDMWAVGILLHALLTGRLPFSDSFEPRLQIKILHSVYEIPTDIGKSAERVLRGCIDRAVASRWTAAMVDEVAWGVGWSNETDEIHSVELQSDSDIRNASRPPVSRRASAKPFDLSIPSPASPDCEYEDGRPRSSGRAPSSRSLSRVKRSHAPVSSHNRPQRNSDRPQPISTPSGPASLLTSSIISIESTASMSSSGSSDSLADDMDDPYLLSVSRERGRRPRKSPLRSSSRSTSPSVDPRTPVDFAAIRYPSSLRMESPIDGLPHIPAEGQEVSRGRKRIAASTMTSEGTLHGSRIYEETSPILEDVLFGFPPVQTIQHGTMKARAESTPPGQCRTPKPRFSPIDTTHRTPAAPRRSKSLVLL